MEVLIICAMLITGFHAHKEKDKVSIIYKDNGEVLRTKNVNEHYLSVIEELKRIENGTQRQKK